MANNYLIKQMKEIDRMKKILQEKIEEVLPEIYAGIALTLSDEKYGWDGDKIEELFADSQSLWQDCTEKEINMIQWCEEETGICVMTDTMAKQLEE